MQNNIPTFGSDQKCVNAFIEIPKGHRNKYEYDKKYNVIRLDRYLYSSSHYPGDYGFIPNTLAKDGDPLDILVMVNEATFPGCLIEARVLGLFRLLDNGKQDDKLLAVPNSDPLFKEYKSLQDVPPHFLKEFEHFFLTYKQLEDKTINSIGWESKKIAFNVIHEAIDALEFK